MSWVQILACYVTRISDWISQSFSFLIWAGKIPHRGAKGATQDRNIKLRVSRVCSVYGKYYNFSETTQQRADLTCHWLGSVCPGWFSVSPGRLSGPPSASRPRVRCLKWLCTREGRAPWKPAPLSSVSPLQASTSRERLEQGCSVNTLVILNLMFPISSSPFKKM